MAKDYRQNTPYEDITDEDEENSRGNIGLPFGLCKKFGIPLPDKATPRTLGKHLNEGQGLPLSKFIAN